MRLLSIVCLFVVLLTGVLNAQSAQRFELNDGSVIIGKLVEMSDGIYRVDTETMGQVRISASKIRAMISVDSSQSHPPEMYDYSDYKLPSRSDDLGYQQQQINARIKSMSMNENFLEDMLDLSQSSVMDDILSDPEIMDAIAAHDYEFLMNHPKMQSLMNSSEIQNLLGEIQGF